MRRTATKILRVVFITAAIAQSTHLAAATFQQTPQQPVRPTADSANADRVLGAVTAIDQTAKQMSVKTDAGDLVTVLLNDKTSFLRVPPGENTLDNVSKIAFGDVGVGDRVYARGKLSEDKKSAHARQLIVMARTDIEKKHQKDREQWQQRGIAGVITAINVEKQELTVSARGKEAAAPFVIAVNEKTQFRRYASDSVKFSDAKPCAITDLKVGDQLRALGSKSADAGQWIGEEIVSGSFLTLGGTVTAIDAEKGEIKINLLGSNKPISVSVSKDVTIKRIPPQLAPALTQKSQPATPTPAAAQTQNNPQPSAAAARPNPRGVDLQEMFDRLPSLGLAELKPGDVMIVSSTKGADPSRVTAIALIAGLDVVLKQLQPSGPARGRTPPNPNTGLPAGVLDFAIGLP